MSAGQTVAFLFLSALNLYLGSWLLGYAAYWFVMVLDETATGRNQVEVHWPRDFFRERFGKLLHLAFLVGVWLLPAWLVLRATGLPVRDHLRPPLAILITGTVLWLMLPVSLLSVMSGSGTWDFLRPAALRRMAHRPDILISFYGYTLPLLLGMALVAYLALFGWRDVKDAAATAGSPLLEQLVDIWSWAFVLPLTAAMGAAALLIYARLVGRLAWLLGFDEEAEEEKDEPTPERTPETSHALQQMGADIVEAANAPQAEEPEAAPAGTYALFEEPDVAADVPTPTTFTARSQQVGTQPRGNAAPASAPPLPEEPPPPVQRRLWVRGIYRFPWYRTSLAAWLFLSLFGLLLGVLVRLQMMVRG